MSTAKMPKCNGNISLGAAAYTVSRAADQTLQIHPPIGSIGLGTILSIHFPLEKSLQDKLKAAFLKYIDGKQNTSFTITRASDQTFEFNPAPGSIGLATALSISFPLEPNLEAKAQAAMLEHINRDSTTAEKLGGNKPEQNLEVRPSEEDVTQASMTSGSSQTQPSEGCQHDLRALQIPCSVSSEDHLDSSSVQPLGSPKLGNQLKSRRLYKPPIPGTSVWDPKTGEDMQKPKRRRLEPEERKEVAQKRRDRSVCQSCRHKKVKCDPKTCRGNKLFDSKWLLDKPLSFHQGPERRLFCIFPDCKHGSGKGFASFEKVKTHIRRMHKEFENDSVDPGFNQAAYQEGRDFESSTQAKGGSTDDSQLSTEQLIIPGNLNRWKENNNYFQPLNTLDDLVFPEDVRMTDAQYLLAQPNYQNEVDLDNSTANFSSAYWPGLFFNNTDYSPVDSHLFSASEYLHHSQYVINPPGNTEFRSIYENNPRRFMDLGFEIDFAPAPEGTTDLRLAVAASPSRHIQTFLRERAQISAAPTGAEDEEEDEESRRRRDPDRDSDDRGGGDSDDSDGSGNGSGDSSGDDNYGGPGNGGSGGDAGVSGPSSSSPSSRGSHDLDFYYWQWKIAFDAKHSPAKHIQEAKACASPHAPIAALPWVH